MEGLTRDEADRNADPRPIRLGSLENSLAGSRRASGPRRAVIALMKPSLAFVSVLGAIALAACGGAGGNEPSTSSASAALTLHAEAAAPLGDFHHDTGLLPAASPAQMQLKLLAGGAIKVDAAADRGASGLAGKAGGGKLALDIHVTMEGRLKVQSALKSYDGPLPGLANIEIPIHAESPFDGLLLGSDESTTTTADLPETTLPPIPLGSVPGSLILTVAKGSSMTTSFHATCVSVAGGIATYEGTSKTRGVLLLHGTIALKLPAPLDRSIDVPEIKVAIPEVSVAMTGQVPAAGVVDSTVGSCAETPAESQPAKTDGGTRVGRTGSFTTAGTAVTRTFTCPRAQTDSGTYTATPTSLTLYIQDEGGPIWSYVYGKL